MDSLNGFGLWLRRVAAVAELVERIGVSTILLALLVLIALTYYGYIRSPYAKLPADFRAHDARMTALTLEQRKVDQQLLDTIRAMQSEMARNSTVYRIRICSEIQSLDLRRRCMEQ